MREQRPHQAITIFRSLKMWLAIATVTIGVSLGLGEVYLRILYPDGLSFGDHRGPLVVRFERNFQFNRFDGPSRGPEVIGAKGENEVRILVQGDSITWGQGVRDQRSLYSHELRERLRSIYPDIEMAVLARTGREIDGHLQQILEWGEEIDPDVIIYQWYINDLELDKSHSPLKKRGWRRFVFPARITKYSYLWYFLDYRIKIMGIRNSYETYMREYFGRESEGWRLFAMQFRLWAAEAKRLSPNVLVALYPFIGTSAEEPLLKYHSWMQELCEQEGIAIIDLIHPLDAFRGDWTQTYSSPFDDHPNATVHTRIAEALFDRIRNQWPDLFSPVSRDLGSARR